MQLPEKLSREVERLARASERRRLTSPDDMRSDTTIHLLDAVIEAAHQAAGDGTPRALAAHVKTMEGFRE